MEKQPAEGQKGRIHLVECPRDAMQGWKSVIPTTEKISYLNQLLQVGFGTLDFGSFVSPKAIPQMADTKEVIGGLDISATHTRLLAIVANLRGAEEAAAFDEISFIGFPFSISETFQQRNTNSSMAESLDRVKKIQELCMSRNKELVIYISMAFGNPYGDPYDKNIALDWAFKLGSLGIKTISLADTVGLATPDQVFELTSFLVKEMPNHEIGVHLHSRPENRMKKIDAALQAGCLRFDGALKGIGGCPLANDELVGNMDTELMIEYFNEKRLLGPLNHQALARSIALANEIFIS
ncbi:MAG: hydroxymethylglutaryl-CoA lyase [Bacteroidetes bacterium]|nr:MAG: hydroxymethylglutaryl-CoA lyase [Bacteroidota bacterium]